MMKVAIPLCVAAAAMLGACAGPGAQAPSGSMVQQMQQVPYRAGSGVVQSVTPAPAALAAAGATAPAAGMAAPATPAAGEPLQRLAIRMDDGGIMFVDTPSQEFQTGARVRLTEDRQILRQ